MPGVLAFQISLAKGKVGDFEGGKTRREYNEAHKKDFEESWFQTLLSGLEMTMYVTKQGNKLH